MSPEVVKKIAVDLGKRYADVADDGLAWRSPQRSTAHTKSRNKQKVKERKFRVNLKTNLVKHTASQPWPVRGGR